MNRCPDLVVCLKRDLQCLRPQASLALIYRPNVAGMKGRVDLPQPVNRTQDLWCGSTIHYHSTLFGEPPPLAQITLVRDNCAILVTLLLNTTYGNPKYFQHFRILWACISNFILLLGSGLAARVREYTLEFFTLLNAKGKKKLIEWCMKEGLIALSYECPKCNDQHDVTWSAIKRFLRNCTSHAECISTITSQNKYGGAHTIIRLAMRPLKLF
ncbi:brkDBD domain-containing protein [Trichonephila clavipes]|uniref:BrkDBD domain-containing protein n=1 Tax=Trichonephila clavipes TaxID=2585209 RepID=A0A8X6SPT8_TRICX|nr:brkDBD domain-containing protein [Trichonephila clavipes]